MRQRILRVIFVMIAVQMLMALLGRLLSQRLNRGDEDSDEFQVAAVFCGRQFHSHATGLRSATAISSMGGVDLDLTDATLDADGATLEVRATMGGVQVTVPAEWRVDVDDDSIAGAFDAKVTPSDDLPEDAPKLYIHAVARMGGGQVVTKTTV